MYIYMYYICIYIWFTPDSCLGFSRQEGDLCFRGSRDGGRCFGYKVSSVNATRMMGVADCLTSLYPTGVKQE